MTPPAAVVSRLPDMSASRCLMASSTRIARCGSKNPWMITACAPALAIAAKALSNSSGPLTSIGKASALLLDRPAGGKIGFRWLLACDPDTARVFVRHEPNCPCLGRILRFVTSARLPAGPPFLSRCQAALSGRAVNTTIRAIMGAKLSTKGDRSDRADRALRETV
jgi:hypothetical protein